MESSPDEKSIWEVRVWISAEERFLASTVAVEAVSEEDVTSFPAALESCSYSSRALAAAAQRRST